MFKKIGVIVLLIVCLMVQSVPVSAGTLRYDDESIRLGKVVEVIDGEVVKVFFFHNYFGPPTVETVKLIGIDTDASVDAFEYTSNRLLGSTVYFQIEDNPNYLPTNMVHANAFYNFDKTISEELLELGYAKVDSNYIDSTHYQSYISAEYNAQLYEEGRWATNLSQTTDRININTATSFQLADVLDIESVNAQAIVSYRIHNEFNDITEIMAVDPMFNAEWFDSHNHLMSVITNINKASYLEMTSLIGNSSNAQAILDDLDYYTRFNEITDLDELKNVSTFGLYYPNIEQYLTLESSNVYEVQPKYAVNINTCNSSNFEFATSLSDYDFKKVLELREDDYLISTVGELYSGTTVFSHGLKYYYTEHINAYTNINTANEFELMTLFDQTDLDSIEKKAMATIIIENRPYQFTEQLRSKVGSTHYFNLLPYIYVYKETIPEHYNSNTVPSELINFMKVNYDDRYSHFTNINLASKNALMDLYPDMQLKVVEDIIEYRNKHNFWYRDDLKEIFSLHNQLATYNKIQSYIVFE